jgi:elongation factor G
MSSVGTSQIRNIAIIGHRGCGKTTLTEALLFATGMTNRMGKVDDGNAITDFEQEERERQMSISAALCNCTHKTVKINVMDTPGFAEFFAEVLNCLWVADCALMVVDAAAGVEVHTHRVYQTAREMNLPLIAVVNKMAGEHTDFEAAVESINEMLSGAEAVPVQIPVGSGGGFEGVVDLVSMRMLTGSAQGGTWGAVPESMADEVAAARESLVDAVAANDDELMEKYFENETLTQDELASGLAKAVASGQLVPVTATDAVNSLGIGALLDFIVTICPAPDSRGAWRGTDVRDGDTEILRECSSDEPFSAVVLSTMSDPYVGRISLLRVVSGTAVADANVIDAKTGERERLSGLATMQGNSMSDVASLCAGDFGCVTKLAHALTGGTLCDAKSPVVFASPEMPAPMHSAAVVATSRGDEDKLANGLARLAEEDVGFSYGREPSTGEMLLHGMGSAHLDVMVAKLARKFEAQVTLAEPKVPYRETIASSVQVQGRHKKQTGGRGQFGDVWIRMTPLGRDGGFEFVNEIKGGRVPTNYIPAVEKGIVAQLKKGVLTGSPVVDVQVALYDGSYHDVDSSDQAFYTAGEIAVRNALAAARCVLLEPVMAVEVSCPEEIMGDVMSDMSGRRGRIQGTESVGGGISVVRAQAPLAEMATYAADLRSISQGRASYMMSFAGYEEVPAHLMDAIVAAHKAVDEEE